MFDQFLMRANENGLNIELSKCKGECFLGQTYESNRTFLNLNEMRSEMHSP